MASQGHDGHIPESTIIPLTEALHVDDLAEPSPSTTASIAIVKLNGGLGTSMGAPQAKASLPAHGELTFIDYCVRQILALRKQTGAALPVIFMNSYRTSSDTLPILASYPQLPTEGIPPEIIQGRIPKLYADTMAPVTTGETDLEWCPPGHGELLPLLEATTLRTTLMRSGYRYLFVSNSDNLGAIPDARIPEWMARNSIPMVMEVCRRTLTDMKGGHIARHRGTGRLILRDSNMVAPGDEEIYEDIERHKYFNTNCLWFDLQALTAEIAAHGSIQLPVIVNRKTLDPADTNTPQVLQLETGLGTSVGAFAGAEVIEVPREKFVPVKTTNHLLVVRSDFFEYSPTTYQFRPLRTEWPLIDLDPKHYRVLAEFDRRFPDGPPSLADCVSLTVRGDVTFGGGVRCRGAVLLNTSKRWTIAKSSVLEDRPSATI